MTATVLPEPDGDPFDAILAIRYGTLASTKSRLYYRWHDYNEPDAPVRMDYYFWVLKRGSETIVVDTGFNPAVGVRRGRTVVHSTRDAISALGIEPEQVTQLIVTHLHYDHTGNLDLFPNAQLLVDARELEFWFGPYAGRACFAGSTEAAELRRIAEARQEGRVTAVAATAEVVPGIRVARVGGHSPGQQVLRIATRNGSVVVASDAAHFYEELELDRPFDVFADLEASYRALELLRRLEQEGLSIAVGHDPEVMDRFAPASPELEGIAVDLALSLADAPPSGSLGRRDGHGA